jgi:hypothetical protein
MFIRQWIIRGTVSPVETTTLWITCVLSRDGSIVERLNHEGHERKRAPEGARFVEAMEQRRISLRL